MDCREDLSCDVGYYLDTNTTYCEECSPRCSLKKGCTGGGDMIGMGGCNACESVIVPRDYDSSIENNLLRCRLTSQVFRSIITEV